MLSHCEVFAGGKVVVALHTAHPYGSAGYKSLLQGVAHTRVTHIFSSHASENEIGDIIVVFFEGNTTVYDMVAYFTAHPHVVYAEPCYAFANHTVPNDPRFLAQWGLENIHAPQAWEYTTGCTDVVVGIVDSGIDPAHPDIKENLWRSPTGSYGWNFYSDTNNTDDITAHGTHVAGIVGALGNNAIGIAGVCWRVKLAALKIGDATFGMSAAIAAIAYANEHRIPVLNNSWGGQYDSPILKHVISQYKGLFVVSAGNVGADNDTTPDFPGNFDCENIISVAATDAQNALAQFSNYGAKNVDIAAPGVDILSTALHGEYNTRSGSSMSAPYVAGAAALLLSRAPHLTAVQVKEAILSAATPQPQLAGKVVTGGVLNLRAMLAEPPFGQCI
ncbi:MAG: S8 family serine peptidase [Defluviitaleaceae bacterium]|nr:S8 family serine peptidase [Defluviitaleaceae bacterium]MCL2274508.1 S8 family serine peptidase [Defluviitaleaceae bacterium]